MKFNPLFDRIVVRRIETETKTKSGLVIPDNAQERPTEGEVVSVGPGIRTEDGYFYQTELKPGDRILFGKWSGTEIKVDGEELLIMKESDVLGVIDNGPHLSVVANG